MTRNNRMSERLRRLEAETAADEPPCARVVILTDGEEAPADLAAHRGPVLVVRLSSEGRRPDAA